jgi:dUTPase
MNFKDNTYNVEQGDSIAGGLITKITRTEVVFNKNNKEYIFSLSLKNTLE